MQKGLITILVLIIFSTCTVPETRIYSLNMPVERAKTNTAVDASIAVILHSPRYLSQPYIACRNSPYQLEISRYSKWDSSPDNMLKEAFKDSILSMGIFKEVRISNTIPDGFHSLKVNLKRFEMSDTGSGSFGELVFDANLISPDNRELYSGTISKKVKLDDKSFLGLARGLSSALEEGMAEIKTSINLALDKK